MNAPADGPDGQPVAPRPPLVVLIGPPGSGKSTVAAALGHQLRVPVRDTDDDVERTAGKTIGDIFFEDGEPRFRELEQAAVAVALEEHPGVLALGGGAVMDPRTEEVLARYTSGGGTVVFLDVSLAHAAPRVGFNTARPLLVGNPRAQWQALMEVRRPVYGRIATLRVSTDLMPPHEVAATVAQALRGPSETVDERSRT